MDLQNTFFSNITSQGHSLLSEIQRKVLPGAPTYILTRGGISLIGADSYVLNMYQITTTELRLLVKDRVIIIVLCETILPD